MDIIFSTLGLLCNNVRDQIVDKKKKGGVTDAKLRDLITRDVKAIKLKLDALSKKDLYSSFTFLQEGIRFLEISLEKSKLKQNGPSNETQNPETPETSTGFESDILKKVSEFPRATGNFMNTSREFESAKENFRSARKDATSAFCNEALNIKDRIFAARLRIVSVILEWFESPETAITVCLSFMKELNYRADIRETFSVYLKGGVKSVLARPERVETVKCVMLFNYALFRFVSKFSPRHSSVIAWPTIEIGDRSFNPILHWSEVATRNSMEKKLAYHPNGLSLNEAIYPGFSAVNSNGGVVVGYRDSIKVISVAGESKEFKLPAPKEGKAIQTRIAALAVDENNNVYVVRWLGTMTEKGFGKCVLNVLDGNFQLKYERALDFFEASARLDRAKIAINKNNDIIILKYGDPHVYVCDNTGEFKHRFKRDSLGRNSLNISGQNEIMLSSDNLQAVHILSEEGNLNSMIEVPEGHKIHGVAFHHVLRKIIVLTHVRVKDWRFLHFISETGELETSTFFCRRINHELPQITSHPSGPAAVVRYTSISLI